MGRPRSREKLDLRLSLRRASRSENRFLSGLPTGSENRGVGSVAIDFLRIEDLFGIGENQCVAVASDGNLAVETRAVAHVTGCSPPPRRREARWYLDRHRSCSGEPSVPDLKLPPCATTLGVSGSNSGPRLFNAGSFGKWCAAHCLLSYVTVSWGDSGGE